MKLLHGLRLEREWSLSEWGGGERERERAGGALDKEELRLTHGVHGGTWRQGSAHLTRIGEALADRLRVGRGPSGVLTWQRLDSVALTSVNLVDELRTVHHIGADRPPL
jgi:hypothetical protein